MARRTAAAALAFHLRTGVESVSESVDSPYSFELRMDAEPKGVGPSKWNGLQRRCGKQIRKASRDHIVAVEVDTIEPVAGASGTGVGIAVGGWAFDNTLDGAQVTWVQPPACVRSVTAQSVPPPGIEPDGIFIASFVFISQRAPSRTNFFYASHAGRGQSIAIVTRERQQRLDDSRARA
ncbi:hypothetical protein CKAH01_05194 [Colletotrichum kahawae]|uniref:Uncharacterized protein n=1 Tax=Colletotrichum kahawae TaxID=34407 RepID=A0AAD9YG93_COLKA|nr:hypothetical protein CKAH01_05194 [Colletotrichum kahawae]